MSQLIVELPLEALTEATPVAFVLVVEGQPVEAGECLPAQLPKPDLPDHETVALAPVRSLSWHQVTLPDGVGPGSSRLKAVLDGLLEDQLLDETAQLHFALAPAAADGTRWVAACDRRWLAMAMQGLQAAGQPAARVLPEWGPPGAQHLHITGQAQAPLVVACSPLSVSVLALTPDTLAWVLPAQMLDSSTGAENGQSDSSHAAAHPDPAPQLSAEPELVALAEQQLQRPVRPWPRHQRWAQAASPTWDMALGLLMRKRTQRPGIEWLRAPRWRLARRAALGLLVVNVLGLNGLAWQQARQHEQRRTEMQRVLLRTFPQVRAVVDAPVQMQREVQLLARATAAPSATDLDAMLSALHGALNTAFNSAPPASQAPLTPPEALPPHTLKSLRFKTGELRVTGLDLSATQRQALAAALRTRGYQATQEAEWLVLKVPA